MNQSYRTDLTDEQWQLLETLIPPACVRRSSQKRRDALGSQCHFLRIGSRMCIGLVTSGATLGRVPRPRRRAPKRFSQRSDSQSVETATMIHLEVGYDGAKQVKGRKRHVLVDTKGFVNGCSQLLFRHPLISCMFCSTT
ncbi:MAG: transposase [Moorea sp. SIO4E2]|nr:transposase [Moorena sp. SIO4E2]